MSRRELTAPPRLSPGTALARLRERLAQRDGLVLRELDQRETRRVHFDTFDGRLSGAGMSLVELPGQGATAAGRLALIDRKTGAEWATLELGAPCRSVLAHELASGPLREALMPIIDVRVLLPQVELRSEETSFAVLDDQEKTVVRVSFEEASLADALGDLDGRLRARLRMTPVRGYERELERVSAAARELGFAPARRSLLDEAVVATGGSPTGTSSKVSIELLGTQRSDAAAAAVLRRLAEVIDANLEGTIADLDAEFLHDLRVAVRRTRAVLRELRAVFPHAELARFRTEFRWLQQVTGPSRDLDVYLLGFDEMREFLPPAMRSSLDPALAALRDRRERTRRSMVRALRSERMVSLRRDWEAFLEELVAMGGDDRPQAHRAISELAGERITKVYGRMLKMGGAIDDSSPGEDFHEIRKKGKELRYLLELFGLPLFGEQVVKPMIKSLKALQDVLGRHQDREVQVAMLQEIAEQVSAMPGRTSALMAMGVLVERIGEDALAARAEFADRFAAFSDDELRKTVRATFR